MKNTLGKTIISKLLTILLVFGSLSSAHPSQTIIGTPCTRNGAIKIEKGEKLVCKKSGKLLKWSRTVAGKAPGIVPVTPLNPPAETSPVLPSQGSKQLTLQASVESNTHLRLELSEDIYLGHCASFLEYKWGVADSYEGIFYRQKKEYLIPIDTLELESLPKSFTFKCPDHSIQSYEIKWLMNAGKMTPILNLLKVPKIKSEIANTRPLQIGANAPGEINIRFPKRESVVNDLIILSNGYFATQSSFIYFVNQPLDICNAKVLDQSGFDVKLKPTGPGVGSTYSDESLTPSGFDRLNGIGYFSYQGSNDIQLKVEISCLASGNFSDLYLHPGPRSNLAVIIDRNCPPNLKDQIFPAIKPSNSNLICKENPDGAFTWSNIPVPQSTAPNSSQQQIPLSAKDLELINAQIKSAQNLGLKAKKIGDKLAEALNLSISEGSSENKIAQIKVLIAQAQEIFIKTQNLRSNQSRAELSSEIKQIAKQFSSLEGSYQVILGST